jgi:hypothetical protein
MRQRLFWVGRVGILAVAMAAIACGYSKQPPKQAFDESARHSVKKIALLQVRAPKVLILPGGSGGALAGGLLGSAADDSNTSLLNARVDSQRIALGRELAQAILDDLKSRYTLVFLEYERPRNDGTDAPADYSSITADADAILDVTIRVAGFSGGGFADYRPWLLVDARLVSAESKANLYARSFSYGGSSLGPDIEHFQSDPKYAYGSFSELYDKSGQAAGGIRAGIAPIAARIAAELR